MSTPKQRVGIPSPHASGAVGGGLGPSASTAQQEVVGGWQISATWLLHMKQGSFLIPPSGKSEAVNSLSCGAQQGPGGLRLYHVTQMVSSGVLRGTRQERSACDGDRLQQLRCCARGPSQRGRVQHGTAAPLCVGSGDLAPGKGWGHTWRAAAGLPTTTQGHHQQQSMSVT